MKHIAFIALMLSALTFAAYAHTDESSDPARLGVLQDTMGQPGVSSAGG
ncbi:MAG: hypothetical protein M0R28_13860 [Pigmentiphaga sp.]|nr:hypothetical protein [Pigmentiphaga sp.]